MQQDGEGGPFGKNIVHRRTKQGMVKEKNNVR